MWGFRAAFVLLIAAAVASTPARADETAHIEGGARAIDGDSLVVDGIEVRLHGVDAPEWDQVCTRGGQDWTPGRVASAWMAKAVAGRVLACTVHDVDRYGRQVATCTADGDAVSLNAQLTRAGLARAYRRYSDDFIEEETAARTAGRGVWAGECAAPWDWRRR